LGPDWIAMLLEEPLRELSHMAAIARDLVFSTLDNPSVKHDGATVVATLLHDEHDRLLFAVSKARAVSSRVESGGVLPKALEI
jgi:hypothetical protein